jgi:peroxiredoxin
VNELNAKMEDPSIDAIASAAIEKKLKALDSAVRKYQRNFIAQNPTSYTALIIKAGIDPVPPVFTGSEKEKNLQLLYWTRDHVFDNVNLAEEKLLRTSILTSKVDYFLDNLTSQNPDSIKPAIDKIAALTRASKPNYQFFMTDLLNKYAKSEIIGMDAVYVHIALTYYDNGKADWMEKNNLDKILTSARALEPVLIGKIAPDFEISDMNNQKITLKDFKAEFTILFFLSPGCDYCRSTAGYVRKVAERFSDKGVRVLTVYGSTGLTENVEDWKRFITQNKLESFTNTADFLNGGLIKSRYNIRATPQLFILGKNKKILFKNLSGEKLEEVMVYVLQHAG